MARPKDDRLEYFPQDTDIHNDRKIRRLRKEYCANGYLIYDYIKCMIYKENGYWILLDDEFKFDVSDFLGCGITPESVGDVIDFCFRIKLFHQDKFNELGVLTSSGIQKRFLKAKRGGVIAAEMLVIAAETSINDAETIFDKKTNTRLKSENKKGVKIITAETPVITAETPVITAETPVITAETPINTAISTQSKVKESKVKEINSNNTIKEVDENFKLACKHYKNNWHLETSPEVCSFFFFSDRTFDKVRADCINVLRLYYLSSNSESYLEALRLWSVEFNELLLRTNVKKKMEGNEGYPFHFFNWLKKQDGKLKVLPGAAKKNGVHKEKTVEQILAERGYQ